MQAKGLKISNTLISVHFLSIKVFSKREGCRHGGDESGRRGSIQPSQDDAFQGEIWCNSAPYCLKGSTNAETAFKAWMLYVYLPLKQIRSNKFQIMFFCFQTEHYFSTTVTCIQRTSKQPILLFWNSLLWRLNLFTPPAPTSAPSSPCVRLKLESDGLL